MAKLSDVAAGLDVHGRGERQGRRVRLPRLALGLHRRGRLRDLGGGRPRSEKLARLLLAQDGVQPIGLGARDSLRLEAGLCLYGHDIDETTSPIEAGLAWSIQKRRRSEGGFPGAARIQDELAQWAQARAASASSRTAARRRARARRFCALLGDRIGVVTSGGFGPSVNGPVAMGYVQADLRRARHAGEPDGARQGARAPPSRRCRSCRTATHARC